jgi:hypothetical protein
MRRALQQRVSLQAMRASLNLSTHRVVCSRTCPASPKGTNANIIAFHLHLFFFLFRRRLRSAKLPATAPGMANLRHGCLHRRVAGVSMPQS